MKLKNLTIAVLAASLGAASFAAQAETSYYGSIRVGIEHTDDGTDDNTKFRNWASRMGFKGSGEVAPGLTGFGHYEFGVDADSSDNGNGALSTRKAYAGLEGGFGRVRIGQDYHTFYNTIVGPHDQPWWGSGNGSGKNDTYIGRTGEALSYESPSAGPVKFAATAYLDDEQMSDGYELGLTGDLGPVELGVAYTETDGTGGENTSGQRDAWGLRASGKAGAVSYAAAYTDNDGVGSAYDIHAGFNNFYVNFGEADLDAGNSPGGVTLGYTLNLGKNSLMWFEAQNSDPDDGGDDTTTLRAAYKYDF